MYHLPVLCNFSTNNNQSNSKNANLEKGTSSIFKDITWSDIYFFSEQVFVAFWWCVFYKQSAFLKEPTVFDFCQLTLVCHSYEDEFMQNLYIPKCNSIWPTNFVSGRDALYFVLGRFKPKILERMKWWRCPILEY